MALDDITKQEKYPVGKVSADRKSVSFDNEWWEQMALHHPHMFVWRPDQMKEGELKLLISHLDDVILDNIDGAKVSDDQKDSARRAREELLEAL